jgi:hypothetical protein
VIKTILASLLCIHLAVTPSAFAQPPEPEDAEMEQFRAAYISGTGLTYVLIKGDKGERLYRYGDTSREAARRDPVGYVLFTCGAPHLFLRRDPRARAWLTRARVVKLGDPDFANLDRRYLAGCRNPMVRSAIPKGE